MNIHHATPSLDRRRFLVSAALLGGTGLTGLGARSAAASAPLLTVDTHMIEVNGRPAKVFRVLGANGRSGLFANEGDRFTGLLRNASAKPLQMHWHGQIAAPHDQDRARPGGGMVASGGQEAFDFELTPGTHWMHSHTLSEQQLLAAPMVTREKDSGDVQDVVVMLHDFSFRSPEEILADLGGANAHRGHAPAQVTPAAQSAHGAHAGHSGHAPSSVHANDVNYDAFLANERTLDDPEVVRVEKGGRVRLRVINGGTATAFFLSTPGLSSQCVAVDGTACQPIAAQSYPIAQGQRIDLLINIPSAGGAFPVLAQVEQSTALTGVVLATTAASVAKLASKAPMPAGLTDLRFEARLRAIAPLERRRADRAIPIVLGEGPDYRWTINGRVHGEHERLSVRQGDRVEMTFMNPTSMMHPMHLHGHRFQVVRIGSQPFSGPLRDTVIVPPHLPVTVAFDARLKGEWFLHCHHLYHMATGMMTEVSIS